MEQFAIDARRRENIGTGCARQYRRDGLIPATVYGHGQPTQSIAIDSKQLMSFLRAAGTMVNLTIEGKSDETMAALIKEIQRHPVSREIQSVDFLWVSLTETVHVSVPVHLVGEAEGVKMQGGSLDQALHEITVACLPGAIPEAIEADVSALLTGQSLHVRDIVPPEGVAFVTSPDEAVAVVAKGISSEDLVTEGEEAAPAEAEAEEAAPAEE